MNWPACVSAWLSDEGLTAHVRITHKVKHVYWVEPQEDKFLGSLSYVTFQFQLFVCLVITV